MFNSEITDKNSPINAIRRVVSKKKKKIPRPPGISGVIEEDVEGEDEEDEEAEEEGQEEEISPSPQNKYEAERVQAEMSSDGDTKAKKIDMFKQETKDEKDKKDKKDKKEKDKKDKKDSKKDKDKPLPGYNQEEVDKGRKLMSNTSFKSNLDKLRQKFKESGKPGLEESADASPKKLRLEPPKQLEPEVKKVKGRNEVEDVDEYGKQSDIMLGQIDSQSNDLRTSAYGTNTKGMKEVNKGKPITPEVKFGQTSKLSTETSLKQKEIPTPEPAEKKKITIGESTKKATTDKETAQPFSLKQDSLKGKAEGSFSKQDSTKDDSSLSRAEQLAAEEEWKVKTGDLPKPKLKIGGAVLNTKQEKPPGIPPPLLKKKKPTGVDSDNSWDEDKNPFE